MADRITMAEAVATAREILERAERERAEAIEREAKTFECDDCAALRTALKERFDECRRFRDFFDTLMDNYDDHFLGEDGGSLFESATKNGLLVEVQRTEQEKEDAWDDGDTCFVMSWSDRAHKEAPDKATPTLDSVAAAHPFVREPL